MARHPKVGLLLCGAAGLLAAAGAGIAGSPAASATGSPTLYVALSGSDSGGNACRLPAHPCATIPYALTQAPTGGSTIDVGAGTFTQPLQITKPVNIVGTVVNGTIATSLKPTSTVADTDPQNFEGLTTVAALVDVTDGATANLSNLVINGSTEGPTFTACGPPNFVGLYYHNASGNVDNTKVVNVQLPAGDFGCQSGDAVYVGSDAGSPYPASHVTFNADTVKAYDKNGITCRYAGSVCDVSDTVVTGIGPTSLIGQNGMEYAFGSSGAVLSSTITGNSYTGASGVSPAGNSATGILVYDTGAMRVAGDTLSGNDVNISASADSGQIPGSWYIQSDTVGGATDNLSAAAGGPSEGNQYGDGIQIEGVDGSINPTTVSGNVATGDYEYGISLFGTAHITVSGNTTNTDYDGIYVDSASGANTFGDNIAKHDAVYDYQDASTGSGTSGTGDTWTGNTCKPVLDSAPEGLC